MDQPAISSWDSVPAELREGIKQFWPEAHWLEAVNIAYLESSFDAFAVNDTTDHDHPCGARLSATLDVPVYAERSVGYFQINSCNFPGWEWQRLYNAEHNCGTAHMLWVAAGGWSPWYVSAKLLGLLP